jgi:hypothetical protein
MRYTSHTNVRVGRLRQQLSQRDLSILSSLHKVRLLSLRQLQRLHVVDGAPTAQVRRAQMVLQRLHRLKLVVRLSRVIGGVRAGSAGYIYGLSGLGQAVLDMSDPLSRRNRRIWEAKPYFQDHMLTVSELYVQLVESSRSDHIDLAQFDAEPTCWRHYTGQGGESVILKPDAYVRLEIGEFERSSFVEVDLGTESLPTIQRKCERFITYWHQGVEQQWRGVFPKVVWLVQNDRRGDHIADVIRKMTTDAQSLFEIGLLSTGSQTLSQVDKEVAA